MNINNSLCLNMIVKNEENVIKDTLINLTKYIQFQYYVISDTGSTDNTKQIIKDFFDNINIKGEIYDDTWQDFGTNRTLALKHAYKKTKYLMIFDADDKINGNFKLPNNTDADAYYLNFGNNVIYKRILIINNHLKWEFVGVLHEYINCIDKKNINEIHIEGNYYVESGKTGSRSNDPQKYTKDALILENAYFKAENNNEHIKVRYSFYTAQSYRDAGDDNNAIKWYLKRTQLNDWNQEIYYSYYMIGLLHRKNNNIEKAIYYWNLAIDVDEERIECAYEIINHYRTINKFKLAYYYYKNIENKFNNINFNEKLFIYKPIYDFSIYYEMSIIYYHNNNYNKGLECFKKIFDYTEIDNNLKINIIQNFSYYSEHLTHDNELFYKYSNFIKNILNNENENEKKNNHHNHNHIIKIINNTIHNITSLFNNMSCVNNIINNKIHKKNTNINILLSITTCKRYDLFCKTINSFLNCCTDINLINHFFLVDDNSNDEDIQKMKNNYPFFEYYIKNENEKGHRISMNIIWNKLNIIKPDYWIHLEDDWLFFKPQNIITKAIQFLKKHNDKNIHQILFNKNYAETINDYDIQGGKYIDDNKEFLVHIKDEPNITGKNCSYWPHYSFRPSITITETILKLGNFDSNNTFFERDYADKYYQNGYISAFFNEIITLHKGKLTSENNVKNAYQLNSTTQFNNNDNIKYIYLNNYNNNNINHNHVIIEKINKNNVTITSYIKKLFVNNKFNSNKNIICNLLTYYKIFKKILLDFNEEYFVIMEYNIYNETFNNNIINILNENNDNELILIKNNNSKLYNSFIIHKNTVKKIIYTIDKYGFIDNTINTIIDNNNIKKIIIENLIIQYDENLISKSDDNDDDDDKSSFEIKNISSEYIFINGFDHYGDDIMFKNNISVNDMIYISDNDENIICFNTLGYFKNNINTKTLIKIDNQHGLFINIKRLYNTKSIKLSAA